jgi:hypothetical protein
MQFEDQNAAMRQMKELLRDQAKFRAKLDRVVRKIETSSERTAKLAERNKARKNSGNGNGNGKSNTARNGPDGAGSEGSDGDGAEGSEMRMESAGVTSAQAVS